MASELSAVPATPRSSYRRNTLNNGPSSSNSVTSHHSKASYSGSVSGSEAQSIVSSAKLLLQQHQQPYQQQQNKPQPNISNTSTTTGSASASASATVIKTTSTASTYRSYKERAYLMHQKQKQVKLQQKQLQQQQLSCSYPNKAGLVYSTSTATATTTNASSSRKEKKTEEEEKKDSDPVVFATSGMAREQQHPYQQRHNIQGQPQITQPYIHHDYHDEGQRAKLVNEMSPMMRMRHPYSMSNQQQQQQQVSANSFSGGAYYPNVTTTAANSNDLLTTMTPSVSTTASFTSQNFKSEEQVKAEKQRRWKRKMKLAQKQQQQEQAELNNYNYHDDDDNGNDNDNSILEDSNSNVHGNTGNIIGNTRGDTIQPSFSMASRDTRGTNTTGTSYDEYSSFDDEDTVMDDRTMNDDDISFTGCQPGTNLNLGELWSSLKLSKLNKAAAPTVSVVQEAVKQPAELFHKLVSARCGGDLEETLFCEAGDDDEGYVVDAKNMDPNDYSYSDEDDEDFDEDDSRGKSGRQGAAATARRRGRSRRPRSKSPPTSASDNARSRDNSRAVSSTSRLTETSASVGDILGTMGNEDYDRDGKCAISSSNAKSKNDTSQSQTLQQRRHLGKTADSVISGGSSKTPQAGTAGIANNPIRLLDPPPASEDDEDQDGDDNNDNGIGVEAERFISKCKANDAPGSTFLDAGRVSGLVSVKSVSFDEHCIAKTSVPAMIPTVASLDKTDPNFIRKFVAGLNHHGTPLMWHRHLMDEDASLPSTDAPNPPARNPNLIMAYLKLESTKNNPSGVIATREDGFEVTTISAADSKVPIPTTWDSPRLVWFEETISSEGIEQEEVGAIDLFDIASIETGRGTSVASAFLKTLESYPSAAPSRTVVVQLNSNATVLDKNASLKNMDGFAFPTSPRSSSSGTIVMEAANEDAAKTFVLGMKWTIARLSFNLIVGNLSISCELLQPEQQLQRQQQDQFLLRHQEERSTALSSCPSGDEESTMGPRSFRLPVIRRTKVMNDTTFHLTDKASAKSSGR